MGVKVAEVVERAIVQQFNAYYDVYIPDAEGGLPLIVGMHGYGGDKSSMMRLIRRINEQDFAIVTLQGPHQHMVYPTKENPKLGYGFGWLTNFKPEESVAFHHAAVKQILKDVTATGRIDANRVYLMGFSQSSAVNFRFAFTNSELLKGVIGICGGIPGDWETEGKYQSTSLDILYLGTTRDQFYTPDKVEANAAALRRRARSVTLHILEAGHEIPREANPIINEWLKTSVRQKND